MPQRPRRLRIETELGKLQTLPDGKRELAHMPGPGDVLVLGIGPDPASLAGLLPAGKAVYVIEAPLFKSQMSDAWHESVPSQWNIISEDMLDDATIMDADIVLYRPGLRFFPSFWGPLVARCRWLKTLASGSAEPRRYAVIPGTDADLLVPEVCDALERCGLRTRRIHPRQAVALMPHLLVSERPALFFSVNFQGLDAYGELYHLLRAAGVTVATWCVDNPFHLLSGLRSPYWREMPLFVTDASFIPQLAEHGATNVHHLPLAAWPQHFAARAMDATDHGLSSRMVFVGRSGFPNRDSFFAGCAVPPLLSANATDMIARGERPDFRWWLEGLGIQSLWPGNEVRNAGFGAETASLERRVHCLMEASRLPLTVYGDEDWKTLLPRAVEVRPVVDYYTTLPSIYRQAAWTLNVTSLLLPAGLTQRHFDVWASGGFLITDNSPGLSIFPKELTQHIAFDRPEDIARIAADMRPGTPRRDDLRRAWQHLILTEHTYEHRMRHTLDILALA
ncbi:spore maturation protein CgeB [Desulfobaculum xiamenense]|uniref:Spore maturation protein CgeB n=1 Tax=Desulfobaculum xiamenense TaxID=995050 RepID=A0A846QKX5_9BACT|nr:DUF3880 domain-containing protein [Desulfobaculum xiamenense]NJB68771.1 spore maturation protein CgeB [Desulfobaculum xiamenense]